jgi:hypothetical protein
MLILNPAIIEFIVAGIITLKNIFVLELLNNRALLINSIGMVLDPRCAFTQSGKREANEIEKTFAKSPIPKNVIKTGSIATGGKALKTFRAGVNITFIFRLLPVNNPSNMPMAAPINNPVNPRQMEAEKSIKSSPLFAHSKMAMTTFVGEGIKFELNDTKNDKVCQNNNSTTTDNAE